MSLRALTLSFAPLEERVPGPLVRVSPSTVWNSSNSRGVGTCPKSTLYAFSVKLWLRLDSFWSTSFFQWGLCSRFTTEYATTRAMR